MIWLARFNQRFALWAVTSVGTMTCAYLFAAIALVALPQAVHDSLEAGPLPLVTWLSQSFLQLTLLSVIMTGQDVQAKATEARDVQQFNAVMETLADAREARDELREIIVDMRKLMEERYGT